MRLAPPDGIRTDVIASLVLFAMDVLTRDVTRTSRQEEEEAVDVDPTMLLRCVYVCVCMCVCMLVCVCE